MVVCAFFLRGNCKFGENCRNEHPRETQRNQSWTAGGAQTKMTVSFTTETMSRDFTPQADKPIWPLSSYGPAKCEPTLISNLDISPEELHYRAVTAIQAGALNDYLKYESDSITAANQIYTNARSNVMQAHEQAIKQTASSDPNPPAANVTSSMFGGTTSAFGQPSAFGAFAKPATVPSAFGGTSAPAFGSTTAPTSVFGGSGFGQSTFGQTAIPASTSAFGQPVQATSAFGQTSMPQSSFIKPASGAFGTAGGGAFGTTSSSQPAQTTSAFGQTTLPQSPFIKPASGAFGTTGTSAFGAPSSGQSVFSTTPGGAASGSGGGGGFSAFAGQPSAFGTNTMANNASASSGSAFSAFGNPPAASSAFGAPAPAQGPTVSAFGAPSAFGALAQPQQQSTSAFGGSAFASSPNTSGYVFGSGGSTSGGPFSNSTQVSSPFAPRPPVEPTAAFAPPQPPSASFFSPQSDASLPAKAKPGPPDFLNAKPAYKPGLDKYDSLLPDNYLQLLPAAVKEAFESQKFEWGQVPELIPPKELR